MLHRRKQDTTPDTNTQRKMSDDIVDLNRERIRRQPPAALALGAFALLVGGVMAIVIALLALARFLGGAL